MFQFMMVKVGKIPIHRNRLFRYLFAFGLPPKAIEIEFNRIFDLLYEPLADSLIKFT